MRTSLQRGAGDRLYECSPRVRSLAVNVLMHAGPAAARHALLEQLVEKIGETCNLTMLSGNDVVYVDRVETEWPLRMHLQPGSHVPLHCSASGKLLLSFMPRERRERMIETLPLRAYSERTIIDRDALRKELSTTRRRLLAINNQEHLQGLIAIAVPVMLDRNQRVCGYRRASANWPRRARRPARLRPRPAPRRRRNGEDIPRLIS